jgi:hypothetical protein
MAKINRIELALIKNNIKLTYNKIIKYYLADENFGLIFEFNNYKNISYGIRNNRC